MIIELENIGKTFEIGRQPIAALEAVSLSVAPGEFVAITGASGSGKSTLLNILGCLDRPTAGEYRLEGMLVSTLDDERASSIRNRRIGFVFQQFQLLPRLSVIDNVLLPIRFSHAPVDRDRAIYLLERVGLGGRLDHLPHQISGGQMQRVAIARAMLMNPALLLADEPTGNLDSKSAESIMSLIRETHAAGQTVVIVTHDAEIAAQAPRQIRLHDGHISHDRHN